MATEQLTREAGQAGRETQQDAANKRGRDRMGTEDTRRGVSGGGDEVGVH